jgi:hypothetical protein
MRKILAALLTTVAVGFAGSALAQDKAAAPAEPVAAPAVTAPAEVKPVEAPVPRQPLRSPRPSLPRRSGRSGGGPGSGAQQG